MSVVPSAELLHELETRLSDRASSLAAFAEAHLIDPHGVVYSTVHADSLRPWTAADYSPTDETYSIGAYPMWEVLTYENSGMTTGAYLAALSHQFAVTRDPGVLARAKRTFSGLRHIYELGREREEGYFPKIYGGRCTHELSTDQYLYAIKGMMAYRELADTGDRDLIARMIAKMVDFWMSREYRHSYFTIPDMLWPLGRFPSLLLAAYVVSEDDRYLREAERINREHEVYRSPIEWQITPRVQEGTPFNAVEQRLGNRYLATWNHECTAMDVMELDECLQHSDAHRDDWLRSMGASWREGMWSMLDNGMARAWTLYDPATGEASSPEPQFTGNKDFVGYTYGQWLGKHTTPRSTMMARVGVNVAKWLPNEGSTAVVNHILENVGFEQMRYVIDPDGKQILPQHRHMTKQICVDAMVNWLWAYWQGLREGVVMTNTPVASRQVSEVLA